MFKYIITLLIFLCAFNANAQYVNPYATGSTNNMVLINSTIFMMGIDSTELNREIEKYPEHKDELLAEYPAFRVTLAPFYLDKYEVTNADFKKFIDANPTWAKKNASKNDVDSNYLKNWKGNKYPKGEGGNPVVYVSWVAAKAYALWVGKRLPMEVELEYASKYQRQGYSQFPWGNAQPDSLKVNFIGSNIGHTVPPGKYKANDLGLYDMAGNVWQFCADNWWPNRHARDSFYTDETLIKGGSFNSTAFDLRATRRSHCTKETCLPDLGFRCAMSYLVKK